MIFTSDRLVLNSSVAGLAALLCLSHSASAQDASRPAAESTVTASEVVVFAQRRSERLEDVPISVTAITGGQIQDFGLVTTQDLQLKTPGLTFESGFGFSQPYIRGIGTNQPNAGLESAVASYMNGAYLVRSYGQIGRLFDMAGVEVLRGAQGTLWGRNATGGAILYTTNPAVLGEYSADISLEGGNYQHALGEVAVNLPVSDTFALRIGAQKSYDNGYLTNVVNGSRWGGGRHTLVRTSLRWDPTSKFSAALMYEWVDDERRVNAVAERAPAPLCGSCALPGGGFNPVAGFYDFATGPTADPTAFTSHTGILRLSYTGDQFDVTSVSSYRQDHVRGNINVAGSSNIFQDFSSDSDGSHTYAEELQAISKFGGILNGMVGLSLAKDQSNQLNVIGGLITGSTPDIASDNRIQTKSYAAFGELYLTPVDGLKITAGIRYSHDNREYRGAISPNAAATFGIGNPSPSGFGNGKSFSEFTPRVVVAYDFGAVNAYLSYNRGFKEGGYNSPSFQNVAPVNPETVDYYEAGAKYVSPDHRLTLNAALFRYKYKNIQVSIVNLSSGANVLQNAAAATGYGGEFGGTYQAAPWLNLFADASLLHTEYDSYPNASIVNITPGGILPAFADLKGTDLPRAPKFQASVGFIVNAPISESLSAHLNTMARYTSSYDFLPGGGGAERYAQTAGYTVVNISGYLQRDLDGSGLFRPDYYRVGFFVNNATDKKYVTFRTAQAYIGKLEWVGPPITYGLRLSAGF